MHIFLDRPAKPYVPSVSMRCSRLILERHGLRYVHILAYLRVNGSHLPHAVKLSRSLEDLVELRDEARFLGLRDLAHLCAEELLQHPLVRLRSLPTSQISPFTADGIRNSQVFPPAPLVKHLNLLHAVQFVHPEEEPKSAVAHAGYI